MANYKPIGGFFGLELPDFSSSVSVYEHWKNRKKIVHYKNARSALYALIKDQKPKCCWLPAYICKDLAEAVVKAKTPVKFFPIHENLSPDIGFLEAQVKKGDLVVAVDYFGKLPAKDFLKYVRRRKDVTWVEDRAQAFSPGKIWGSYVLYSARKLLGVPDGGLLVGEGAMPAQPKSETLSAKEFAASLLRFEDIEQTRNDVWYAAYRQAEEAMKPEIKAMSRLSQWILHHTPWRLLGKDRQKNFRYLQKHLRDIALIQDFPRDAVPFGFPIQVKNRDNIIKKLHAKKIFAAIHWPNLPSSAKAFPFEHQMAKSILTLPCDHRYTEEEMQHIVLELRKIL